MSGLGLSLDDVVVDRGGRRILAGVSARLAAGGIVAVCGPNGAGKSSLVLAIAGMLPHRGRIAWDGAAPNRREIAFLPQATLVRASLSVLEVVLLGRIEALRWRLHDADLASAAAALHLVGMSELAKRRMDTLSGGQQQLVLLAQRLVREPRLLLLDEPTSALDLRRQLTVLDILDRYARSTGALVIVVLHDLSLAARYARDLLLLAEGRLRYAGTPREVLRPDRLREIYAIDAEVLADSTGNPIIAPVRALDCNHPNQRRVLDDPIGAF